MFDFPSQQELSGSTAELPKIQTVKETSVHVLYRHMQDSYSETVVGSEIIRSQAASNCVLTDMHVCMVDNIYVDTDTDR